MPNAKIKANDKILDLDGKPMKMDDNELTVARAVALMISGNTQSPDPLRAYTLARTITEVDLKKAGEIELNTSDVKFIKEAISTNRFFTALVAGQILEKLEK